MDLPPPPTFAGRGAQHSTHLARAQDPAHQAGQAGARPKLQHGFPDDELRVVLEVVGEDAAGVPEEMALVSAPRVSLVSGGGGFVGASGGRVGRVGVPRGDCGLRDAGAGFARRGGCARCGLRGVRARSSRRVRGRGS